MDSDRLGASLADRYRLEREIGQGGMATVYLAHDLRHDRKVAVKVLRPELSAILGAARFLHEIKTTANLQHPHIVPLHDSGEAAGQVYYVMPFIEGESLRDRLTRDRQLPIEDALRIAREVADALDYAHQHRVVHRDIKPENILLHGGHAMVADFGIALAASQSTGGVRMTETGMSLGTPHYMSPEQAMGEREITPRSDIYALGAILYEMLTGEPPFNGATAQAVFARVLTETPRSITAQRHTVPAAVEATILKALEKLPADRFATAARFAEALEAAVERPVRSATVPTRAVPARRQWATWTAVVLLLPAAYWLGGSRARADGPPITGFGRATKVTWDPGLEISPAPSPDGKYVAYAAGSPFSTRIFVRQVTGGRPIPLTTGRDETQSEPGWSADGARVLYRTASGVFSAPATGGTPRTEFLSPPGRPVVSAAWAPTGDRLLFATGDSIYVTSPGASPRAVAQVSGPSDCRWSPHATFIACTSGNPGATSAGVIFANVSASRIVVVRVRDGASFTVSDSLSANQGPAWSPDERWIYYVSSVDGPRDIYAAPVGADGAARGRPRRLTTGLGAQTIALTPDGSRVAYAALSTSANIADLPGHRPLTSGQQNVDLFSYSPDGRWILYASDISGINELYRIPSAGGEAEQLTSGSTADNFAPDLSPDGKEVAFHSLRTGNRDIFVLPLDGGPLQQVTATPAQELGPRWSPDGRSLSYSDFSSQGGVWVVTRGADGRWGPPRRISPTGAIADWSPDGSMITFAASVFGEGGLSVIPAAGGTARQLLATGGEIQTVEMPKFAPDGRTIIFKSHDRAGRTRFWSIPVAGGVPHLVAQLDPTHVASAPYWDMSQGRIAYVEFAAQSDIVVMETTRR